jgi:CBS domain containing-hemolysin-like protein
VLDLDDTTLDFVGILAILVLVFANGFFVAAEFSLVAMRRSRVAELVMQRRVNATALQRAIDHLDAHLAATQLGITIASLALGWIGEPALAHLIEPLLGGFPSSLAKIESHAIAVLLAFVVITTLHIVLGELAPKSLALQRSERTALYVVRPLTLFLFVFRPAIAFLNGLGNWLLKLVGLQPGGGEEALHSPEELKLLIAQSQRAGLLQQAQQEVVERVLNIGNRRVGEIMTPRPDVVWVDAARSSDEMLQAIRACHHEQLLVSRKEIHEVVGVIRKRDLVDQILDGQTPDPASLTEPALAVHESAPIFDVLAQFRAQPVHMAIVLDEYGSLEGIVTQTDLLEAIAGDIPAEEGEEPEIVAQEDGSYLIDGMMAVSDAFNRLRLDPLPDSRDFHTVAGFALSKLGRIPSVGDSFIWGSWRFQIVDMDGRRIDKLLVRPLGAP